MNKQEEFVAEVSKQDAEAYCVFRGLYFITVYCKYRKKILDLSKRMDLKLFGIIVDTKPLPRIVEGQ